MKRRAAMVASKSRSNDALERDLQIEGNPVRNELLLNLPTSDHIFSHFTFVRLRIHEVLQESEEPIKYAYFINSGLASILNSMTDGKTVEVGLSGKEGCTALPIAVGLKTSASRVICQVEGSAFRITAKNLEKILKECPALEKRMQQ